MVHGLVGMPEGSAHIMNSSFHPMTSVSQDPSRGVRVDFINLETLLGSDAVIHLLKCDIEGSEGAFIENYPHLLRRTRLAIFEFHHDKCDRARCSEQLQRCGFVDKRVLADGSQTSLEFYSQGSPPI